MEFEYDLTTYMHPIVTKVAKQYIITLSELEQCAPKIIQLVGRHLIPVLQNAISDVYFINKKHAPGSLPKDQVYQSIHIGQKRAHPWEFKIFLDDSLVKAWVTQNGEPIYKIGGARDEWDDPFVTSFEEHWQLPLFGHIKEEAFMEYRVEQGMKQLEHNESFKQDVLKLCIQYAQKINNKGGR